MFPEDENKFNVTLIGKVTTGREEKEGYGIE
jgi:hypothetical protein